VPPTVASPLSPAPASESRYKTHALASAAARIQRAARAHAARAALAAARAAAPPPVAALVGLATSRVPWAPRESSASPAPPPAPGGLLGSAETPLVRTAGPAARTVQGPERPERVGAVLDDLALRECTVGTWVGATVGRGRARMPASSSVARWAGASPGRGSIAGAAAKAENAALVAEHGTRDA